MGCDIHAHLEVKRVPFGDLSRHPKWMYVGQPEIVRSYGLFRAIGTEYRGNGDIIFPAKGLPSDATKQTKDESDFWDEDGHTFSSLTLQEIMPYEDNEALKQLFEVFSPLRGAFEDENIRIVFWFDN